MCSALLVVVVVVFYFKRCFCYCCWCWYGLDFFSLEFIPKGFFPKDSSCLFDGWRVTRKRKQAETDGVRCFRSRLRFVKAIGLQQRFLSLMAGSCQRLVLLLLLPELIYPSGSSRRRLYTHNNNDDEYDDVNWHWEREKSLLLLLIYHVWHGRQCDGHAQLLLLSTWEAYLYIYIYIPIWSAVICM